ncbi:MAG: hypothetical protein JNM70_19530 [Anaerolineae bacterium]|nr:hypothetical protein [Anaerolineae bacterium]
MNELHHEKTMVPAIDSSPYDSSLLAAALAMLSRDEIDSMLSQIASLEMQIAKLTIAGHEDAMMHLVTQGLQRLTYLLDATLRYKNETGDGG